MLIQNQQASQTLAENDDVAQTSDAMHKPMIKQLKRQKDESLCEQSPSVVL